jgi:SAM-dependent methyltransferase
VTSSYPAPTFRDPDGSLVLEHEHAVRTIRDSARDAVLRFVESPLYQRLQERGDIVATVIDDSPTGLLLLHPRIPIPTYPWEWTPSQWIAAAELTLNLCQEALSEGWILKDASPLNILFTGPRPVLVDVLSFDEHDPASSIWLAYGQYVRTFLLPLLMNRLLHWPLALSLFRRDGYEPAELFSVLGWRQRFSRNAFWPITLPAWLERSKNSKNKPAAVPPKALQRGNNPELALHILESTLNKLRRQTRRAAPGLKTSDWSEYPAQLSHYTAEQSSNKQEWVREVVGNLRPPRTLDIGANTGEYSVLVAETGAEVVALERDAASADRIFRISQSRKLPIQTIHADIARPTPAVGWDNNESSALLSRLEGQFDLVLMLAVVHHLLLLEQIPLPAIASLCHRLTRRYLLLEWVPVSDPMFQELMRGREALYGSLREDDFLAACNGLFTVLRRHTLGNGRILLLLEKDSPAGAHC